MAGGEGGGGGVFWQLSIPYPLSNYPSDFLVNTNSVERRLILIDCSLHPNVATDR